LLPGHLLCPALPSGRPLLGRLLAGVTRAIANPASLLGARLLDVVLVGVLAAKRRRLVRA
jgi:hypothetical protein